MTGGAGEDDVDARPPHVDNIDSSRLAMSDLTVSAIIHSTLATLIRLNIFEALAAAGDGALLTAEELAELAMPGKPINVAYLGRLLRMVSSKNILCEVVTTGEDGQPQERRFGLEPMGKFLVADAEKGSFAPVMTWGHHPAFLHTWGHLHESVVDDTLTPFARANGLQLWEYLQRDREYGAIFNKGMVELSKVYMHAILDVYPGFEDVKVLVDVGGGFGSSLSFIVARYPHVKGINFDQPHVISASPDIPGVEHVGGDFFESIPNGGDAIFMKLVLHNWDDESCVRILKNCFKALPAHGKVIVVDSVLPESSVFQDGDSLAFTMDILMIGMCGSNARQRREGELRKLALDAGFPQLTCVCKVDHYTVTELRKA